MKKQIKNILIIVIIITGIIGAWFIKNNNEIVKDEDLESKSTQSQADIQGEDKVNEDEEIKKSEVIENINEDEEIKKSEVVENIIEDEESGTTEGVEDINEDDTEQNNEETEGLEKNNSENNSDVKIKIDINDPNFELSTPSFDLETLTAYGLPILLDFGAEWCGPCQKMHPILEELNNELRGKAIVKYIDIDEYPEAAKDFDFSLIPTQYFITKDGNVYKSHTGIMKKENVIKIFNEMGMEE